MNFLRKLVSAEATPEPVFETNPTSPCEEQLDACRTEIAHLQEQKVLHARALKEMYQYLTKLDASFRAENKRLQSLLDEERERSTQLIEITKDLWDLIEKMDAGDAVAEPFPIPSGDGFSRNLQPERVPELPELAELMAVVEPTPAG